MFAPPQSSAQSPNPLTHLIQTIFSYNGSVLLAAIISLLLVILFVLLLHIYAKWFLAQARNRRRRSVSISHVLGPSRFHHFNTFTYDTTLSDSPTKGLDAPIIASIPLFVYKAHDEHKHGLECVICLSPFEDDDVGRNLPKCGHAFHVECVDMWLQSHSNCPICRAPVVCERTAAVDNSIPNEMTSSGQSEELSVSAPGELGWIDVNTPREVVVEIMGTESENVVMSDSLSSSSSSSSFLASQPSLLGCTLKRMLSRSRSEPKVYPSSYITESEA